MIVEIIAKSEVALTTLGDALSKLHSINAFGALMEIGAEKARLQPSNHPMEHAALTAAWHEGYYEAIKDLYGFQERFRIIAKSQMRSDFGAADMLYVNGEITQEEYVYLTGKQPPNKQSVDTNPVE